MPKLTRSSFILGSLKGPGPGAARVPHDTEQDIEPWSNVNRVGIPGPSRYEPCPWAHSWASAERGRATPPTASTVTTSNRTVDGALFMVYLHDKRAVGRPDSAGPRVSGGLATEQPGD